LNPGSDMQKKKKSDWGTLVPRINVENVYIITNTNIALQ
jgi:hypothetical protein